MLRNRIGPLALGLSVPACDAGETMCDVVNLDIKWGGVEQVQAAAEAGADIVLLDNMSCAQIREAIELIDGRSETEASGGVTLETVREIAGTGVNFISVGALTHSAPSVDIALDFDHIA